MSLPKRKDALISCVVPCYNEGALIQRFIQALEASLDKTGHRFEILVIDDGSSDNTKEQLQKLGNQCNFKYFRFSRNFGKEHALSAGLDLAKGDAIIFIDADFQHPLDLLQSFIDKWQEGYDMVYGVRQNREDETWLKRTCAKTFYRLVSKINRVNIPSNAGDFRLLDRCIVEALQQLPERNRFMKGLYSWVGFKQTAVPYIVQPREAGSTSWNFYTLLDLAITGITSFTAFPLRLIAIGGIGTACLAVIYGLWIVLSTFFFGRATPGWATIVTAISFFSGLQLFALGVVGEYIGRIFDEVKSRPLYIIDKEASFESNTEI